MQEFCNPSSCQNLPLLSGNMDFNSSTVLAAIFGLRLG